ncbi:MAG: VIT domain-containing protein, partial [Flavobacteriales bacterium]
MKSLKAVLIISVLFITSVALGQNLQTLSPYFHLDVENPDKYSPEDFALQGTIVKANIAGVIADVTVEQLYVNNTEDVLDAEYVFPGSTQSAVYAMEMQINERVIKAKVKEKQEAKRIFAKAKTEGKSATLMEQERPNVFKMSLANIKPGDSIRVRFSYTENIIPKNKEYEFMFPTVVGPRFGTQEHAAKDPWISNPYTNNEHQANKMLSPKFDLSLSLNAGLPIQKANCYSHPKAGINYTSKGSMVMFLPNKAYKEKKGDVIFRYQLAGEKIEGGMLLYEHGDENFFMMTMQPPERPEVDEIPPRDYLFVVDVSGSMNGFPIEISKELMKDLLYHLSPKDRFNVLLFANGFSKFSTVMVPVSNGQISRAMSFVDNPSGSGGTMILPALKEALAMIDDNGRSTTVVIATDGLVTVEKQAMDLIQEHLGDANFFPFGIGSSVNRYLLEALAHVGHSEPIVATDRSEARKIAKEFRKMISAPVLTNVKLDFGEMDAYEVIPKSVPDLFADKPIVVYGKYRGKTNGKVTVTGSNGSGRFEQSMQVGKTKVSAKNSGLRYLWARQNIKLLADYRRF